MWTRKSKQWFCIAATATFAPSALASSWNGEDGNWNESAKWSGNQVPGVDVADAVIPAGTVTIDQPYSLNDLDLTGGAIGGSAASPITVGTQFRFLGGSINSGATLNIHGVAQLGNGPATLTNAGSLSFAVSPTSNANMTFNNSGSINLAANVTLQLLHASTTSGQYTGSAGSTLLMSSSAASPHPDHTLTSTARIATGAFHLSAANFYMAAGSVVAAGSTLADNYAIVSGDGEFQGPAHFASATVFPGQNDGDIGTLHFGSTLTLDQSPVYLADVKNSGGTPTSDLVDATGKIALDGVMLGANVVDSGTPLVAGQRFVVIYAAGGLQGDYTTMIDAPKDALNPYGFVEGTDAMNKTYGFHVDITPTEVALVYVDTSPTPEPGLLLPATVLPMLISAARRRRLP